MSKICMAGNKENEKINNERRLQERFPEIPDAVISKILIQYSHNMEKCITILREESDRYLYGEESDSPVIPTLPSMEPLSIQIPSSNHPASELSTNYYNNDSPRRERALTVGIPTSGSNTVSVHGERHTQVDEYSRQLVKHQQQRLERLIKELQLEENKLHELKSVVVIKNEELVSKKFRVAGNPSRMDVDHLEEETQVLREEIDGMTQEIDRIKSLPMPLKKSESFPRPTSWVNNLPMNGPHGPRPPWVSSQRSHSPDRDRSLEGAGWILVQGGVAPPPPATQEPPPTPTPQPVNSPQDDTEQTWVCKHCTLVNHGALNLCELCERPRI